MFLRILVEILLLLIALHIQAVCDGVTTSISCDQLAKLQYSFLYIFLLLLAYVLPRQNKLSDQYKRIQGENGDFNSAQTCFRSFF